MFAHRPTSKTKYLTGLFFSLQFSLNCVRVWSRVRTSISGSFLLKSFCRDKDLKAKADELDDVRGQLELELDNQQVLCWVCKSVISVNIDCACSIIACDLNFMV